MKNPTDRPESGLPPRSWGLAALAFLCGALVYAGTLPHNFAGADREVILANRFVQEGASTLPEILTTGEIEGYSGWKETPSKGYRPLALVTFALEQSLLDGSPRARHLLNLLLYGMLTGLLFLLFEGWLGRGSALFAGAGALLFAVHPVHVEAVAALFSRGHLLALTFLAGTLFVLQGGGANRGAARLAGAAALFLLALLSHEVAVSFLLVLPAVLIFFDKWDRSPTVKVTGLLALVALVWLAGHVQVVGFPGLQPGDNLASHPLRDASTSEALASRFSYLGRSLGMLVAPITLVSDYSTNHLSVETWGQAYPWIGLVALSGLLVAMMAGFRRGAPWSVSLLWVLAPFVVTSGFFAPVGTTMAERFLFVSSAGACLLAATVLRTCHNAERPGLRTGAWGVTVLLIALFATQTFLRLSDWQDDNTLYSADVVTAPGSIRIQEGYGRVQYSIGRRITDPDARTEFLDRAVAAFEKARDIDPKYVPAWMGLGSALLAEEENEAAAEAFARVLELDPTSLPAALNRAAALFRAKKMPQATEAFLQATSIDPKSVNAWHNLGVVYQNTGRLDDAIAAHQKALELDPKRFDVLFDLGSTYFRLRKLKEARDTFRKAVDLQPGNPGALNGMGAVLHMLGDYTSAIQIYEQSLRANANQPDVLMNISKAYRKLGDETKEKEFAEKSKELKEKLDAAK
ncbi:MAG TPA: tetratricopeptide repeat protein [Planctomycetes bacterium]|nr:tetratricopeptide repeat protein [Planctomycetota bacterium]